MSVPNTRTRVLRWTAAALAALVIAIGITLAAPTPRAQAATADCGDGRCTVWLSKSDTRALANGSVPAPPAAVPVPLRVAYYALAYVHKVIAGQYANRGWCSAFRIDYRPWATQGYFGYPC